MVEYSKSLIAGSTIILILIASGIGYLSIHDYDKIWNENSEGKPLIIQYGDTLNVMIPNDYTTYTRYKIDKDWINTYAGKSYISQNRYRPCYWTTYGEDRWVCPDRKVSKTQLSYDVSSDDTITITRITEYYGYESHSGTLGQLKETLVFNKGKYKQNFEWIPENENRQYKITMETQVDKDVTFKTDLDGQLQMYHDEIPITLNYQDMPINEKQLIEDTVYLTTICNGACYVDPSIGISQAKFSLGISRTPRWDNAFGNWTYRLGIRVYAGDNNHSQGDLINVTLNLTEYLEKTGLNMSLVES